MVMVREKIKTFFSNKYIQKFMVTIEINGGGKSLSLSNKLDYLHISALSSLLIWDKVS